MFSFKGFNHHRVFILIFLVFTVLCLSISVVSATDITQTNKTSDGGIKSAITGINDGEIIFLENGIYSGENNTGLTISKSITIEGKGDNVILNGEGKNRFFTIKNNVNVTLKNLKFINGYVTKNGGGAIYNQGTLNIVDSKFTNNSAKYKDTNGGAIYNSNNLFIQNSEFINNFAIGDGGAIHNQRANIFSVKNSIFSNNNANDDGSVINNVNVNTVSIDDSEFMNNFAGSSGGVINNVNDIPGNKLMIVNSVFSNNSAYFNGGVIFNFAGDLDIKNSSFSNNVVNSNFANSGGGAIYYKASSDFSNVLNITDSKFTDNFGGDAYESIHLDDIEGKSKIHTDNLIISDDEDNNLYNNSNNNSNNNNSDNNSSDNNNNNNNNSPNTPNTPNTPKLADLKIYNVKKSGNYCIVYIKNYGKLTAKSSYLTASAGGLTFRFSAKSIKAGKTTYIKFLIPKKYRSIYNKIDKTFKIDSTNRVKESNEKNNVMVVRAKKADLKIYKVKKSSNKRYIYIKNYGNVASKSCYLKVSASGQSVKLKVKAINAGKSIYVKLTIPNKYRKYLNVNKVFKVDSTNIIKESNEKNNSFKSK
ncbi:MAG: hypothetical protein LBM96_03595 [Methanobrevibacter sp.]|jgi:hypothetical protein|nr:hypothetical protein [Candidatus Methanoflexus mossambicus]